LQRPPSHPTLRMALLPPRSLTYFSTGSAPRAADEEGDGGFSVAAHIGGTRDTAGPAGSADTGDCTSKGGCGVSGGDDDGRSFFAMDVWLYAAPSHSGGFSVAAHTGGTRDTAGPAGNAETGDCAGRKETGQWGVSFAIEAQVLYTTSGNSVCIISGIWTQGSLLFTRLGRRERGTQGPLHDRTDHTPLERKSWWTCLGGGVGGGGAVGGSEPAGHAGKDEARGACGASHATVQECQRLSREQHTALTRSDEEQR
jgi:hypothetical protein